MTRAETRRGRDFSYEPPITNNLVTPAFFSLLKFCCHLLPLRVSGVQLKVLHGPEILCDLLCELRAFAIRSLHCKELFLTTD